MKKNKEKGTYPEAAFQSALVLGFLTRIRTHSLTDVVRELLEHFPYDYKQRLCNFAKAVLEETSDMEKDQ